MTHIVGLTGGVGCGKSVVSQLFSELDVDVIDTDVISREITQPHGLAIPEVEKVFGTAYLTEKGSLNREKMRKLIFSDKNSRWRLEKILHPIILRETIYRIGEAQSTYVIVVVPLLIETPDYDNIVERILVIDCDEQLQIARTMARSKLSEQQTKAIIAAQATRRERLQKADDVIINNQDIAYLTSQVTDLHKKYLYLFRPNPTIGV